MGGPRVTRKASPIRRTPPAEAAGRIARRRRGHDRGPAAFIFSGAMAELTLSRGRARRLDVSPATLRRWVRDGIVPLRDGALDARGGRPGADRRPPARARPLARRSCATPRSRAGSPTATWRTCSRRRARTRTLAEAAEETGLEPALIERIWAAAGFPRRLARADRRGRPRSCCATSARCSTPGFPLVAFLQLVRVYGQALAQIADAEVKLFHLYVHEPLMRDGVARARDRRGDGGPRRRAAAARLADHGPRAPAAAAALRRAGRRRPPRARGRRRAELGRAAGGDRVRRPRRLHAADRGGRRGGGARRRRALRRGGRARRCPTTRA